MSIRPDIIHWLGCFLIRYCVFSAAGCLSVGSVKIASLQFESSAGPFLASRS